MTLNQLCHFQMVAKYENYRKAAEELYISQPSLSRSIAALEEELQVPLFEKSGRGVILTKGGKIFLEYVERVLHDCEMARSKMQEMASGGGRIDIGYVFPLASHYIPHSVRQFLLEEENENVTFNFYQNHTSAILQKVKAGELDVGFGGYIDKEDMDSFPVLSAEMVLITPKGHPLEGKEYVSVYELSRYPVIGYDPQSWLGNYTKQLYRRLAFQPSFAVECPDEHSIMAMVSEQFGIALVPHIREIDGSRVNIHKLHDIYLEHRVYMFWMRERYQLPVVKRFIEYMKAQGESQAF